MTDEDKKKYVVGRIKEDVLEDWLNERVSEGYEMVRIFMNPNRSDPPKYMVLMRLESD